MISHTPSSSLMKIPTNFLTFSKTVIIIMVASTLSLTTENWTTAYTPDIVVVLMAYNSHIFWLPCNSDFSTCSSFNNHIFGCNPHHTNKTSTAWDFLVLYFSFFSTRNLIYWLPLTHANTDWKKNSQGGDCTRCVNFGILTLVKLFKSKMPTNTK